jgi:hypothetical protein
MNVKTLINFLQKEDPEMRVVVNGYEGGYDEVEQTFKVSIIKNQHKQDKWWDGEFLDTIKEKEEEVALLLPRKS